MVQERKTLAEIQALSDVIANHWRMAIVAGIVSKAGNGSAQISGLSAATDAPIAGLYMGATSGTRSAQISTGSITFIADRVQIDNTSTDDSGKVLQIFWWDKVA